MEKLTSIKEEGLTNIEACEDLAQLQQLRVLYLGKKGPIQEVMKSMKELPKEERPAFGQQVNEVKALLAKFWRWIRKLRMKKLILPYPVRSRSWETRIP